MSRSVPSPSEVQATFVATLFDEWCALGLRDVVLSPGSRSTPLALAAAAREDLTVHVRLDERSAGFFALGRALVTRRPVAIVTTSGTAAAELHACVAEADLAFVPLLVVTADRPPELRGVGAPQTIAQTHLYASMVRLFEEPGVAREGAAGEWRPLARRLWHAARGAQAHAGPVHLNASFVEPLVAEPYALSARDDVELNEEPTLEALKFECRDQSVLAIVGAGVSSALVARARALNWVVLGDATARDTLAYYDPLLRSDDFAARAKPSVVLRLGGVPASKVLAQRCREWAVPTVALSVGGFVADPDQLVTSALDGELLEDDALAGDPAYVTLWREASAAVAAWLASREVDDVELNEVAVARAVVRCSSETATPLVVGSSMPVRDVEWWTPARTSATFANRGVNGIDGVVSTVLGVAAGARSLGLVGDLTMLHDVSALVDGLGDAGGTCALVVADNQGGGIFSFLSQASSVAPDRFERLFGTPRPHDLVAVATAFGHEAASVGTVAELDEALAKALAREGVSVIVARVPPRAANVALHDEWNHAVSTLVAS